MKNKYSWDITKIYKTDKEFMDSFIEIDKLKDKILVYKGHILDDENTLYEFLTLEGDLNLLLEKSYVYAWLKYYKDMADVNYQKDKELITKKLVDISSEMSFILPELLKKDSDYVKELITKNKKLEKYKFNLEKIYRYKKHTLSEVEEKMLGSMIDIFNISNNAYMNLSNTDVSYGKIKDENNKLVELTNSNYSKYIQSNNRKVRKAAFDKMYLYYKNHINTFSSLYVGSIKCDSVHSKLRKYKSSLSASLYKDNINEKLYTSLIEVVDKNIDLLKEYYKIKGEFLGIENLHMYDIYCNMENNFSKNIDIPAALKMLYEAFKVLGNDYIKNFKRLIDNNSVDFLPTKNKISGAFQSGVYGVDPYVSLNYENDINSVSTLAHEMGHAMHTYYAQINNEYHNASYPIFLAEVASTVNEILFNEYMYQKSKTIDEKIYYLFEFLDKFKATVYRQVMFAEFEYLMHTKYEKDGVVTKDDLCSVYYELNKKHFDKVINVDKDIQYEWARIPHFYDMFYVYKYATGFISALIIVNKLQNEKGFNEKYIKEFLSKGGSDYPLNILLNIGVDITNIEVLNSAFEIFNNKLNILKNLINERRKNGK